MAQEGIEAVRSLRDQSWDNLVDGSHYLSQGTSWQLSTTPDDLGIFSRNIDISSVDDNTKKITSLVSWQFTAGRGDSLSLVSYLTNWHSPITTISDCNSLCVSQSYISGDCLRNTNQCSQSSGEPYSSGDQYCTGGSSADTCCCYATGPTATPTTTPIPTNTPIPTLVPTVGPTATPAPTNCNSYCQQIYILPGSCLKSNQCSGYNEGRIYECSGSNRCCCQ